MEKKGEILNQLAIISDLIENANIESNEVSVVFVLNNDEFNKMSNKVTKKTKVKIVESETTFSVKIGKVEYVFTLYKD